MLWRAHYEPHVSYEALPWSLEDGTYCGAGSVPALMECGVWLRLLRSAEIDYQILVASDPLRADEILPPSDFSKLIEVRPATQVPVERSFFAAKFDGQSMLVVGPPTEEIWDAAQNFVARKGQM